MLLVAGCTHATRRTIYVQPWAPVDCTGEDVVEVNNSTRYAVDVYASTDARQPSSLELVGRAQPGLSTITLSGTSAEGRPAAFQARMNEEPVLVGVHLRRRCDIRH